MGYGRCRIAETAPAWRHICRFFNGSDIRNQQWMTDLQFQYRDWKTNSHTIPEINVYPGKSYRPDYRRNIHGICMMKFGSIYLGWWKYHRQSCQLWSRFCSAYFFSLKISRLQNDRNKNGISFLRASTTYSSPQHIPSPEDKNITCPLPSIPKPKKQDLCRRKNVFHPKASFLSKPAKFCFFCICS